MTDQTSTDPSTPSKRSAWWLWALLAPVVYIVSSGPIIATGFWLRDKTDSDWFYGVMFLYYPLLRAPFGPIHAYISWWVELFGTRGPG